MKKILDFTLFGDNTALKDEFGRVVTYQMLEEWRKELPGILSESASSDGALDTSDADRPLVMILCRNSLGCVAGYAALVSSGYPVMLVSGASPSDMVRRILMTYRPALILMPADLRASYASMKEMYHLYEDVILKTNFGSRYSLHPDLAMLLSTSGSTGSVKFVRQSWENVRFNAEAIADYLAVTPSERTITALPMQYTYGLSVINANLMRGATVVVTQRSIMDADFWNLFEEEEITSFHGVPSTYDMLWRIEMFAEDFPDLKTLTQAGGKLSIPLHEYYAQYAQDFDKRFVIMYGQCEATAAISYLAAEESLQKIGSVGKVIPGGQVLLMDENGNEITQPNTQGELVYKGPNVALGYAADGTDLEKGDEWKGTLRTGDVAERDEDGYLYITGRLKRFIKIMGHRVSLDELDTRIMENLFIESVSTGTDDHLVIFVTSDEDRRNVLDFVRDKLNAFRTHTKVVTIESFPKNEAGKIRYGELLERAKLNHG